MDHVVLPDSWSSWHIVRELGEGAYGTVYLAEKKIGSDSSESAIKIIQLSPKENDALALSLELGSRESVHKYYEDIARSYIQEIRTMIALKGHPNIIYIEDYAVEENPDIPQWTIWIRMEYLTPFTEYAQSHTLQEQDVIRLGSDLCSALAACEQRGIIHRDIKPSNILASPMGQFKLGDFGVARKLDRTSGLYSAKGTFPYMAPEVYHNKPYDQRSDIYSLGLMLYLLLNKNREPFVDLNKQIVYMKDRDNATARRMGGEPLPPPAEASPTLAKVILKACDPDPEKRYPDAESFRKALQNAQSPDGSGSGGKWFRRILIATVVLAAAAALLFYLGSGKKPVPKDTASPTPTLAKMPTSTETPIPTPTPTLMPTPSPTEAPTPTPTPTPTLTPTLIPTETPTPTPAPTLTPAPTPEPTPTLDPAEILFRSPGEEVKVYAKYMTDGQTFRWYVKHPYDEDFVLQEGKTNRLFVYTVGEQDDGTKIRYVVTSGNESEEGIRTICFPDGEYQSLFTSQSSDAETFADPAESTAPDSAGAEIDISHVGIIPIMAGKHIYFNPQTGSCVRIPMNSILEKLQEAGYGLTDEDSSVFRNELKKQFFPDGNDKLTNGEDFSEGDKIRLAYRPNDEFAALLERVGFHLRYDEQTFVVIRDETKSRLRFEQADP